MSASAKAGGFYSYDFLENLVGCDIHSANRIMPDWQDIGPGDQIRLAPQVALAVATVEPGAVPCSAQRRLDGGYIASV